MSARESSSDDVVNFPCNFAKFELDEGAGSCKLQLMRAGCIWALRYIP